MDLNKQKPVAPKEYLVDVHADGDYSDVPTQARYAITEELAKEILNLATLVKDNKLLSVERFCYEAEWIWPEDVDEGLRRTECDVLVVYDDEYHFKCYIKHTDIRVCADKRDITELAEQFGLPLPAHLLPAKTGTA